MDLGIEWIPREANKWTVVRAIAQVLHSDEFLPRASGERATNFRVKLNPSPAGGIRNDGTGILTLPTEKIGAKFLSYVSRNPIKIERKKLRFFKRSRLSKELSMTLHKTPFVSPDVEEEFQNKLQQLQDALRVDAIQFGLLYRAKYPTGKQPLQPRSFSIEWEGSYTNNSVAWMKFEYEHKLILLELGDRTTERTGKTVAISFTSIQRIAVGYDGNPYICFDTLTPPVMEKIEFHRMFTGDEHIDNRKFKQRIGSLHPAHAVVAPYAPHLRVVLYHDVNVDVVKTFIGMCKTAGLATENLIVQVPALHPIEAHKAEFFLERRLHTLRKRFAQFDWPVAFQLESLLYNGILNTSEVEGLMPEVRRLCDDHALNESIYVGDLLRHFNEFLQIRSPKESPQACFNLALKKFDWVDTSPFPGTFRCCHVTFTPTRTILEGPYPTQSNRVIRRYEGYENHFIRVDFRDEDRLQYRWTAQVDGTSFLRDRVGGILKQGFELAGRPFEFLAYSSSALREHAVWFMNPFRHPSEGIITSNIIRSRLGNFEGTELLKCPSKYGARLAQAFTATAPSVEIRREEWEMVRDLGPDGKDSEYLFTDGVGTISKSLGDRIWAQLCSSRRDHGEYVIQPSAYQIRFLGFKGVVAVDEHLDNNSGGILMRLRPSMRKFEVEGSQAMLAPIEIAQAFENLNICYLNRPLIMILEDLGVRKESFQELQDIAVAEARTIHDSISQFHTVLDSHNLGRSYRLSSILKRVENLGLTLGPEKQTSGVDTPFLMQLREVAMMDVLREIKHSARIPIPDSYLLVGVADEGPAYRKQGSKNVYILPEMHIYVCIQRPGDPEPTYLEGSCSISRSPVAHPGDVQRVRAIGRPPGGMLCLFRHLKNVVILPSVGSRSLASCLGGGDVDGDLFSIIHYIPLLQSKVDPAASYTSQGTLKLDRDSTVDDICDFVVEYINSDVLGLLSDRLLIIADQSAEGIHDKDCLGLAKLCSQAVDFPKQGIPVDLDHNRLPHTLIRCKPDWHAAEVVSPRHTDYYESSRALGHMYRSITLVEPHEIPGDNTQWTYPLADPISVAVKDRIRFYLGNSALPDGKSMKLARLFNRYAEELRYICATHTLSNTPGTRLLEAEVVVGTILAKCSQKRWRKDRMYRMRLHTSTLVRNIQRELIEKLDEASIKELTKGLESSWTAWDFSLRRKNEFGANSFGLIALGTVFDCLDRLY